MRCVGQPNGGTRDRLLRIPVNHLTADGFLNPKRDLADQDDADGDDQNGKPPLAARARGVADAML